LVVGLAAGLVSLGGWMVASGGSRAPATTAGDWGALPLAARFAVSRGLGAEMDRFAVRRDRGGRVVAALSGGLAATFGPRGASVAARGRAPTLRLGLRAVGRRGSLRAVAAVAPAVRSNGVSYRHGGIREWYANGPLGLEQGFALARRPAGAGPLTLVVGSLAGRGLRARIGGGALRAGAVTYGDLSVLDARGRRVPASIALAAGRVLLRVDDAGAAYPLRIDPLAQAATLTAADAVNGDALGFSVAVSADGLTVAAGATHGHGGLGAVYVFSEPQSGLWQDAEQTAELTASDGAANDELGYAVSISADGTTIAGGAINRGSGAGAVYVFSEPATGSWGDERQNAELTASTPVAGAELGHSVAISADGATIAAGAPAPGAMGAAYVFNEPSGGWQNGTEAAVLTPAARATSDIFGSSIALSGDGRTLVTAAPSSSGRAYVFTASSPTGWATASGPAVLTASDANAGDTLGWSVAISADGRTVAAGDPGHLGGGAVYVFSEPPAGPWLSGTQTARLTPSDAGGNLGWSVGVSAGGDTIVAGAFSAAALAGAVYVFAEPATGGWVDAHETGSPLTAFSGIANDGLGTGAAIAADGGTVIGGAAGTGSGSGAAFVFSEPKVTSSSRVACAPDPAAVGSGTSCTATVTDTGPSAPATPTGRVTFHPPSPSSAQFAAGSCTLAPGSAAGVASCSVGLTAEAAASYTLALRYGGDSRHLPSTASGSVTVIPAPTAVTLPASAISSTRATLHGTVDPNGVAVDGCSFGYGPGRSYGSSVGCASTPGSGRSAVPVSAVLHGLAPGTTYHFGLRATGPGGMDLGDDETFTTPSAPLLLGRLGFVSTAGGAGVFVGCSGARACHVSVTVERGKRVAGRRSAVVPADSGAIVPIELGAPTRRAQKLAVSVAGPGGAGARGTVKFEPLAGGSTLGPVGFVSRAGRVGMLLGCGRIARSCAGRVALALGKTVVAGPARYSVATGSAGVLRLALNRAGRRERAKVTRAGAIRATLAPRGGRARTVRLTLAALG
jgi:hypothetical protein